jgi:large subunit ribosomal protein L10
LEAFSQEEEKGMARPEKVAKVEKIREMFQDHQVVFLTDFTGLKVDEINDLRFSLREKGAEYRVLKNTLTLLAIKETEYENLGEYIVGPVAAAFTFGDPMAVAKELVSYSRDNPNLKIKGGFMEGRLLDAAGVRGIATLPSREVLLARVVGSLNGPLSGLHAVLSGPYRKLVYALKAVSEAKPEAA